MASTLLESTRTIGREANGMLMTPQEFDRADFDENYVYELINGVLVVSPIPSKQEVDPNEELGYLLRDYHERHPEGAALNATLPEQYVHTGRNRRRADRLIWAGLGRLPRKHDKPTIAVEFVSKGKRDRKRDYVIKKAEYKRHGLKEYWIVDRFRRIMTVFVWTNGKGRRLVIQSNESYRTPLLPGFELKLARLLKMANRWDAVEESDED